MRDFARTLAFVILIAIGWPLGAAAQDLTGTTKSVDDTNGFPVEAGDTLVYTVTVLALGAPATDVQLLDVTPISTEALTIVSMPPGATDSSSATVVDVSGFDLAAGASADVVFSVSVRPDTGCRTVVCNQGLVGSAEMPIGPGSGVPTDDPDTRALDDATCVTVECPALPDFDGSTKTVTDDDGPPVEAGDVLTYTVTVRNVGGPATDVQLVDTTPATTEGLAVLSVPAGAIDASSATAVDVAGFDLATNTSAAVVFSVRVRPDVACGTRVCNQGVVGSAEVPIGPGTGSTTDDPSTPAAPDATCVVVECPNLPALVAVKTVTDDDGPPAAPGDLLTYRVTLRNDGGPATGVQLLDAIPADVEALMVVTIPAGAVDASSVSLVDVRGFDLGTGASEDIVFSVRVRTDAACDAMVCNQGVAGSAEVPIGPGSGFVTDDPTTMAPGDATCVTVACRAPLFLGSTKTVTDVGGPPTSPGDLLRYDLTITNSGTGPATDVTVIDDIPTETEGLIVESLPSGAADFSTATRLEVAGFDLAPLESATVRFTVTIRPGLPAGTPVANQAFVGSVERPLAGGGDPTDDPATATLTDATLIIVGDALALLRNADVVTLSPVTPALDSLLAAAGDDSGAPGFTRLDPVADRCGPPTCPLPFVSGSVLVNELTTTAARPLVLYELSEPDSIPGGSGRSLRVTKVDASGDQQPESVRIDFTP